MALILLLAELTFESRDTIFLHDMVTLGNIKSAMTSMSGDTCGNFDVIGHNLQLKLENDDDFRLIYIINCSLHNVVVELVADLYIATDSQKSSVSIVGRFLKVNVENFILNNSILISRNRHPEFMTLFVVALLNEISIEKIQIHNCSLYERSVLGCA